MPKVWNRELRWSTPVEDVVRQVIADQGVGCWFEPKGLVRTRPRVQPSDPGRLIDALGVRRERGGDVLAAGIGQLMAALYESRSV